MFIKLNKRGFTLVEIMNLVAILGFGRYRHSQSSARRMNANEGAIKSRT